jgi:hypothetical protein
MVGNLRANANGLAEERKMLKVLLTDYIDNNK